MHLICLALNYSHAATGEHASENALQNNKNQLKVLTLNIQGLIPVSFAVKPQSKERVEELARLFAHSDYDVIFLQEVWTRGYREILEGSGFPYLYHDEQMIGIVKRKKEGQDLPFFLGLVTSVIQYLFPDDFGFDKGLMILSRFPLKNLRSFTFSQNGRAQRAFRDGEFFVNKGVLMATIDHPSLGAIRLVNTHCVSHYRDFHYTTQRLNQLKEIEQALAQESGKTGAVIVGGDLNMVRNHLASTFLHTFRQADLAYEELSTLRTDKTYPDGLVVDHLFSRGSLMPKEGRIVFKDQIRCGDELCFPSDHYGLETIFIPAKNGNSPTP